MAGAADLTLKLGLRYDYQAKVFNQGVDINDKNIFPTTGTPTELPLVDFSKRGDKNNFGPRVGVAWDVKGNGATVRARGLRHLLQPDEHPDQGRRARELPAADRHHRQPDLPGSRTAAAIR